jgi:hypothetical protein
MEKTWFDSCVLLHMGVKYCDWADYVLCSFIIDKDIKTHEDDSYEADDKLWLRLS